MKRYERSKSAAPKISSFFKMQNLHRISTVCLVHYIIKKKQYNISSYVKIVFTMYCGIGIYLREIKDIIFIP